jgi:hypothetical protein
MNRLELYPLGLWKMSGAEFEGSNYGLYYELLSSVVLQNYEEKYINLFKTFIDIELRFLELVHFTLKTFSREFITG